jgi:hypothetical protein
MLYQIEDSKYRRVVAGETAEEVVGVRAAASHLRALRTMSIEMPALYPLLAFVLAFGCGEAAGQVSSGLNVV